MGRKVAGAAAAAGWAARWPAEAPLRVMTAAVTALPAAVRVRRSFGYACRDVLILDKGAPSVGARFRARLSPGHMPATSGNAGRAAAYGHDAGAGRRAAHRRPSRTRGACRL